MRFGLIGLGAIGQVRAAALARTPGCSLTAAHDLDAARARATGAVAFDTADALLASDACDAVVISTPPDTHEALAVAAMERGKHVLVEKPMANSAAACRRMVEVSRRTGRVLTVGFNHRYFDAVKVVRDAVRSGAIGRLSHVRGYAGHVGLAEFKAPWMYDKDVMGGGTLMDNGIHLVDLVQHLMGDVASVAGAAGRGVWGLDRVEDNGFALLRGTSGVLGSLHSSWSEWRGYRFWVEAYGDRGMARAYYAPMGSILITMDRPGGARRVRRDFYPGAILRERLRGWQSTVVRTFVEEFQAFAALARGETGDGVIARAEDGWRAVAIAEAIYASSEAGRSVALEETMRVCEALGTERPEPR
ncbi:MAG: Gfo/Idh/MocA family oxidoreductase [Acetobacteraceae bacterium]|nr:Gfo/Idh/MocA family oxidoreductase [Acetobacteraceae bacterium]